MNWKYEGLRSHTHLKGLAMGPYKLLRYFIDWEMACQTSLSLF